MTKDKALIRMDVAYDGTNYCGWQRQEHDPNSLQQVIEEALEKLFRAPVSIHASGRTDSGVHARQQVFHFNCPRDYRKYNLDRGLQRYLPKDIAVKSVYLPPAGFHSRFQAIAKEYRYYLYEGKRPDPFRDRFMCLYYKKLHLERLNAYAQCILGMHDFVYFANKGSPVSQTERKIYRANWRKQGDIWVFQVIGEGFLKQMVRNLVGNMLYALESGWEKEKFAELLSKKPSGEYRRSAAARGLFLYRVYYPSLLDKKCLKLYE